MEEKPWKGSNGSQLRESLTGKLKQKFVLQRHHWECWKCFQKKLVWCGFILDDVS